MIDDESATTCQVRKWTLVEIKRIRELLANGGIPALPESLRADATEKVSKSGDPWPNWLIMGLGVRALRQMMEGPPVGQEAAFEQSTAEFAAGVPKPAPKKGGRR